MSSMSSSESNSKFKLKFPISDAGKVVLAAALAAPLVAASAVVAVGLPGGLAAASAPLATATDDELSSCAVATSASSHDGG